MCLRLHSRLGFRIKRIIRNLETQAHVTHATPEYIRRPGSRWFAIDHMVTLPVLRYLAMLDRT